MAKVILFDFDGTIADSFQNFLDIVDRISIKYNLAKLNRNELDQLREKSARELIKNFKIPFYKLPFIARDMKRMQGKNIENIKPFKHLPETMRKLKNSGIKLGILTSNGSQNVKKFLKNNDIEIFDYIHTGTSIFGKDKVLKRFIATNKLEKGNVIYVGDEIRDIEACRKVGIKIAAVTWGFNSKYGIEQHKPDFFIEKPEDLLKLPGVIG